MIVCLYVYLLTAHVCVREFLCIENIVLHTFFFIKILQCVRFLLCARAVFQIHIDTMSRQNRSRIRLQLCECVSFCIEIAKKKARRTHTLSAHSQTSMRMNREIESERNRKKNSRIKNDGPQQLTKKIFHATYMAHSTRLPNTCRNAWITTMCCVCAICSSLSFVMSPQSFNLFLILVLSFLFFNLYECGHTFALFTNIVYDFVAVSMSTYSHSHTCSMCRGRVFGRVWINLCKHQNYVVEFELSTCSVRKTV